MKVALLAAILSLAYSLPVIPIGDILKQFPNAKTVEVDVSEIIRNGKSVGQVVDISIDVAKNDLLQEMGFMAKTFSDLIKSVTPIKAVPFIVSGEISVPKERKAPEINSNEHLREQDEFISSHHSNEHGTGEELKFQVQPDHF